jgi:hypothetical protein
VGALAVSMMGWSLVRMPGDIEPKESKGGDQAGSQHILNEGRAWVLALFAVGLGTEARHVALSNSPMHRSTKRSSEEGPPALSLLRWTGGAPTTKKHWE